MNHLLVGIVTTTSPRCILYKSDVLPAASRPTIKIRAGFFDLKRAEIFANKFPIFELKYEFTMLRNIERMESSWALYPKNHYHT